MGKTEYLVRIATAGTCAHGRDIHLPLLTPTELALAEYRAMQGTERVTTAGMPRGFGVYCNSRTLPKANRQVPLTLMDYESERVCLYYMSKHVTKPRHSPQSGESVLEQVLDFEKCGSGGALTRALIVDEVSKVLVAMAEDQELITHLFQQDTEYEKSSFLPEGYKKKVDIRDFDEARENFQQFIKCRAAE